MNKTISGWGKTNKVESKIIQPKTIEEVQNLIKSSSTHSLISRGLGRSYGDAAQLKDCTAIDLEFFQKFQLFINEGQVRVGAGISFAKLLEKIVPAGFFLPVAPGTKNITVGGAVASDVHGKNHHVDGSFGDHVIEILLIDGYGEIQKLSRSSNPKLFWATIGGMGLTGVIIDVTFSLISIDTPLIKVDTIKFNEIDKLMDYMVKADKEYKYSVAWIDSLSAKGRGILTCGDHLDLGENKISEEELIYKNKQIAKAPSLIPNGILNRFTVRAFNEAWYRQAPKHKKNETQTINQYFYPLDGIGNWNNIYGSKGFIQYQFVVPDNAASLIKFVLDNLRKNSAPSFLTVLKRFGNSNLAPLSFPKRGWTLAIDIPANIKGIYKTLDDLDEIVASSNGRIYLSKDSRMNSHIFKSTYLGYKEWKDVKNNADPKNIFYSDLARRLEM